MGEFESFIGINPWTALFTLLNFLALFFVMKHFLVGPVLKLIQDRQKEIDDLYKDAGDAKDNALTMEAEYKEKLAAAVEYAAVPVYLLLLIWSVSYIMMGSHNPFIYFNF